MGSHTTHDLGPRPRAQLQRPDMSQSAALHNFFIVNRAGGLIYSRELTPGSKLAGNELLMLASTFHSLHAISKQLAPVASGGMAVVDAPTFSLHCLESPTGVKFFVTARPQTPNVPGFLKKTYEMYADYVLKNPFYELDMPIRVKVRGFAVGTRVFSSAAPPLSPPPGGAPLFPPLPAPPLTHCRPSRSDNSCSTTTWRRTHGLWASPRRRGGKSLRRRRQRRHGATRHERSFWRPLLGCG